MPLTSVQSDALVAAIREVAATEILPRFRNLPEGAIDAKASFDDLVTIADRAAEDALTARFEAILPGDAVIGEESISAGTARLEAVGHGRCVVIDPIDGTWNFANGLANFGVIVAVVEEGQTVWGCLYDPSFDDWVMAAKGQGCAFVRNGSTRALRTDPSETRFDHLRGNVGEYLFPAPERQKLAATIPAFRRALNLGASVHEYRMMCMGGSSFCLNGMLNVWDHAAGALCLEEAGGVSRLLDGTSYSPGMGGAEVDAGRYLLNARDPALWDRLAAHFNETLGA
jgi:fructose-1,6-bisphosphatase/inositol monophosphatase family enzyme